jgi:carboxyl-terminal processing protease
VDGGSTQLKGVTPDIILPDNFHYIKTGERDRDNAMAWTEIAPVAYSQDVADLSGLKDIAKLSEARVSSDETFQRVLDNAKRLEIQRDQTAHPISLDAYQQFMDERQAYADKFKDLFEDEVNTNVVNLKVDQPGLEADESKKARNDNWVKSVKKDVYLHETLKIMNDMLDSQGYGSKE